MGFVVILRVFEIISMGKRGCYSFCCYIMRVCDHLNGEEGSL